MKFRWLIGLVFLLAGTASGATRALWWWYGNADKPWGTGQVLGQSDREAAALAEFDRWGFNVIYGSYKSLPVSHPELIAAWNASLDAAGLESHMLLGEYSWIYPAYRPDLLDIVQERLIDFNASRTNAVERFDGLHLDIEPQALDDWKDGTPQRKRELLELLLVTFEEVRQLLDGAGETSLPLEADLAIWYDSSTSIGWTNSVDRDQWFDDLSTHLSGISLMAYKRETLSSIFNGVIWEVAHFAGDVRIGLNAKIGIDGEWPDFDTFTNRLTEVEAAFHTTAAGTSVHSFSWFESAVPISPGKISLSDAAGEVVLCITNLTVGKTYALEQRDSLSTGNWQQVESSINWDGNWSLTNYPGTQRFYRIHGQ